MRALAVLLEPPAPEHAAIARALALPPPPTADEHTDVIVFQAYPYASVYLGDEGMLGGEARDRIAGMWRSFGATPPPECDHLSVLLGAVAALDEPARSAFAAEHVTSWMPPYLATLARIGTPFFQAWARTLAALLDPPRTSLHWRMATPPATPRDLDDLLATVLAPVRVGFVIVRDDLARAAEDLRLGLRTGERRFALRALLEQDAGAVLTWLAGEARAQASAMDGWWRERALAGAQWLDALGLAVR